MRERSPCSRVVEIWRFQVENKRQITLFYVTCKNNIKSAFLHKKLTIISFLNSYSKESKCSSNVKISTFRQTIANSLSKSALKYEI